MRILLVIVVLTVASLAYCAQPAYAQASAIDTPKPAASNSGAPATPLFYIDPQTAWIEEAIVGIIVVAGVGVVVSKVVANKNKSKAAAEAARQKAIKATEAMARTKAASQESAKPR